MSLYYSSYSSPSRCIDSYLIFIFRWEDTNHLFQIIPRPSLRFVTVHKNHQCKVNPKELLSFGNCSSVSHIGLWHDHTLCEMLRLVADYSFLSGGAGNYFKFLWLLSDMHWPLNSQPFKNAILRPLP